jgi:hypothetical protein
MSTMNETVRTAPATDTGAELLENMRGGVATVEALGEARALIRRFEDGTKLARELNAFMSFALSDGAGTSWRTGSAITPIIETETVVDAVQTLRDNGRRLQDHITDQSWIDDVERDWEGRKVTIWQPSAPAADILRPAAKYAMDYDNGHRNSTVSPGTVISGEIYAVDIQGHGSIGLRSGHFQYFDSSMDATGARILNPQPMAEYTLYHATVENIFNLQRATDGSDRWLSSIAIREIADYSNLAHPQA